MKSIGSALARNSCQVDVMPLIRGGEATVGGDPISKRPLVSTIESPGRPVPGVARAVAVASDHVNRYALLEDGRLVGWGHPRWWPKGVTEVVDLGRDTARACAARVLKQ